MKKATLTLVAIICLVCLAVGLVACNLGDDMDNLTEKEKYAKVLSAFIDYFIPQQTASKSASARRKGMTSAEGAQLTVDDVLTKTLQPSSYDGAQRLSLPLTYCYFLTKLCENDKFVIGDKPVAFVATESPEYPMTCIVQFSYDKATGKLTLYLLNTSAQLMGGADSLMYCEIYYDEQSDSIKDFTLHGNKVGSSENASGILYYEYITIQKKGNELKEGDTYYYPANGDCLLQGVAQENAEVYGEYHVNLLDGILNDFLQKAQDKDTLTTDFGEEMRKTSLFARDLIEKLQNSGNDDGDSDDDGNENNDKVTEAQWNQALDESSFMNFTATWTITGDNKEYYAEVDLVNNKYKFSDNYKNEVYYSSENKLYYKYEKTDGDAKFTRYSIEEDDFIWNLKGTESTLALDVKDYFGEFEYDQNNGYYIGEHIRIGEMGACNFYLTFDNGKLVRADIDLGGNVHIDVRYVYGNTRVTLPQDFDIDGGGSQDNIQVEKIELSPRNLTIKEGSFAILRATISPSNATDKTLYWSIKDTTIAVVENRTADSCTIRGLKEGKTEITVATRDGAATICSIEVTNSSGGDDPKVIPVENIYFNDKETSMLVGENIPLPIIIEPANATDKSLTWESSDPSVVSVDARGNMQSHAVGTVTITATAKNGRTATITVRVDNMPDDDQDEPISITLNETNVTMRVNDIVDIDANIFPVTASGALVTWSSMNPEIATVDERGIITAVAEGSTTIVATTYNKLEARCSVTVSGINDEQQEIPVENIVITPEQPNMYVGETITLTATIYPENATDKNFQWSADSPAVELTDNLDGTCTIRAMVEGAVNVFAIANNGAGAPCLITIISVANLITLDTTYLDMTVGETATINAIVNGNIEANIQWLTSSDFVTCIDSSTATSCTIRALEAGDTTITAIHHDNNGFSTEIGAVNIHVNPSMMTFVGRTYNCYDIASEDISAEDLDSLRPQMVNDFLVYFKSDIEAEIDQKSGFGHMECNYVVDGNTIRFTVTFCMTGGEPNTAMEGYTLEFHINGDELSCSNYVEGKGTVTYLLRLQN